MDKQEEAIIDEAVEEIDAAETKTDTTTKTESLEVEPTKPRWWTRKKVIITSAIVAALVVLIAAIPFLRYGVMGLVVHKQVTLTVVDAGNSKPVSGAVVTLGRNEATSDASGKVTFNGVAVGDYTVSVEKKYYATDEGTIRVPIFAGIDGSTRSLKATGRTISIAITNLISGKPVAGAAVNIQDSTAVSDDKGVASVILPVKADAQTGTVKADGYNDTAISVMVKTNDDQQIASTMTPSGTVYFLSKRTGVINVMSAKLDGSDQKILAQGTGNEDDNNTTLLSSQNWKYMMLIASRDKAAQKLYLIRAENGNLSVADDRSGLVTPIGWVGTTFYYQFTRNNGNVWQSGTQELVAYNADSGQRQTIDSTVGAGDSYYNYAAEMMSTVNIVNGSLIYAKSWQYSTYNSDKSKPMVIMKVDGVVKSTLLQIPSTDTSYITAVLLKPGDVGFGVSNGSADMAYYEYASGKIAKTATLSNSDLYSKRLSYLISPDGTRAFWTESRDGKNVLLTSDLTLANPITVSTGDFIAYGWYGNDYVLYSKNQSELFIAAVGQSLNGEHKITDFHKAAQTYPGYGYGYGASY